MNACKTLSVAILLMLCLMVNKTQARVILPPYLSRFSSFEAFRRSLSEDRRAYSAKPVSESLRRIPDSDPNPTQNR